MPELKTMTATDNRFVRKWGNKLFAIGDYGVAKMPAAFADFFGTDKLPKAPPTGMLTMGYITTDGIKVGRDVSSTETEMDQDLEPVREDIEKMAGTLSLTFGESNAWTNALYHGLPVAKWAAKRTSAWSFSDGDLEALPDYVGLIIAQDGVGANAAYRIEAAYRLKPNNFGERQLARRSTEGFEFGFKVLKDPAIGKSMTRGEDGPFFTTVNTVTP